MCPKIAKNFLRHFQLSDYTCLLIRDGLQQSSFTKVDFLLMSYLLEYFQFLLLLLKFGNDLLKFEKRVESRNDDVESYHFVQTTPVKSSLFLPRLEFLQHIASV